MAFGAMFAGISGMALLLWYATAKPDLNDLVATFVPNWTLWLLVPGAVVFSLVNAVAVVFSLVNAVLKESAYRGVVQHSLESAMGVGGAAPLPRSPPRLTPPTPVSSAGPPELTTYRLDGEIPEMAGGAESLDRP